MAASTSPTIEPVSSAEDFTQIFHCVAEAFGRQAKDSLWIGTNPGWDTTEGQKNGVAQFIKRWQNIKSNKDGKPNTLFLKATLPDPEDTSKRRIVGMAIWQQASFVDGYGDPLTDDLGVDLLQTLEPTEARFATQMFKSLWKRRIAYAKEKASADLPAIFVLDMCAVDPDFQRRGIAQKLVQWGLDEAKRRGGLECTTEASSMGRGAYQKLGFKPEGTDDMVYEVDEEFKSRDKPPNVFLRTGVKP
ncbi:putative GNAT family acetyltransferase [Bimuria novae-zelandiae CBS 107.79]|uniref:Putative GNAT family acetyltransferase n=1 Tax=Bimuria novae-zelandiae CBS 107.79 TaxID=1447943 RepID=A0A6A5UYY5_9PLEO|nr:putative GNAT family acetyltransferase [Bimuria novae-zelandiae CBS 107.79]